MLIQYCWQKAQYCLCFHMLCWQLFSQNPCSNQTFRQNLLSIYYIDKTILYDWYWKINYKIVKNNIILSSIHPPLYVIFSERCVHGVYVTECSTWKPKVPKSIIFLHCYNGRVCIVSYPTVTHHIIRSVNCQNFTQNPKNSAQNGIFLGVYIQQKYEALEKKYLPIYIFGTCIL